MSRRTPPSVTLARVPHKLRSLPFVNLCPLAKLLNICRDAAHSTNVALGKLLVVALNVICELLTGCALAAVASSVGQVVSVLASWLLPQHTAHRRTILDGNPKLETTNRKIQTGFT